MTYNSEDNVDKIQKFAKDAAIGAVQATLKNPVGRVLTAPIWVPVASVAGLAVISKQLTQAALNQPISSFEEAAEDLFF